MALFTGVHEKRVTPRRGHPIGVVHDLRSLEQRPSDKYRGCDFVNQFHGKRQGILHRLAAANDADALKAMLIADANLTGDLCGPLWFDESGRSPVHVAARAGAARTIALLLEAQADVNEKDHFGYTALHDAAATPQEVSERVEVAWRLLDAEAEVDTCGRCMDTPLHLAACYGHEPLCAMLLERLADPSLRDWSGSTPMEIAVHHRHHDAAQLLKMFKALKIQILDHPIGDAANGSALKVTWIRSDATAAEVCERVWMTRAHSNESIAGCPPFYECKILQPWVSKSSCQTPLTALHFLHQGPEVLISPDPLPAWERQVAETVTPSSWSQLWSSGLRNGLDDLKWSYGPSWHNAELPNNHPLAISLKNMFNSGSSRFTATAGAVRLLRNWNCLSNFKDAISHLEGRMLFPVEQDPQVLKSLASLRLGIGEQPRPNAGRFLQALSSDGGRGGPTLPAEVMKHLRSYASALIGPWRLQHVSLALAWGSWSESLERCWLKTTGENAVRDAPRPGQEGQATVVAYLVAYNVAFPISEKRHYRRHCWDTSIPPGFDLYVLPSRDRPESGPPADISKYELLAMDCHQALPIAALDVQRKELQVLEHQHGKAS